MIKEIPMKDKKYIFFIDIDDTLILAGTNEIQEDIVAEIERLKKLGHIFVISTGRAFVPTVGIKRIEAFQYLSVILGSCIYEMPNKNLIFKANNMPSIEVKEFTDFLNSNNIAWSYKTSKEEKTIYPANSYFSRKMNCKATTIEEFNKDLQNNEVMQLLADAHLTQKDMSRYPNYNFFLMPAGYTDVSLKNASKDRCIDYFKKLYPNHISVSIGDSTNDIPMFNKSNISIAMGNAKDEIKKVTTFVTKDIRDGGLINVFKNILKI